MQSKPVSAIAERWNRGDVFVIVLQTTRLILRRISLDDAAFILELLNDPAFVRNVGDKGVRTIDDARQYILKGPIENYERLRFGLYLVELQDTAVPIGICGLLKRETLEDVDIGFAFLPYHRSKGYAVESASAVMTYGRDVLGLKRIVAVTSRDNDSSANVLGKIGLRFERMIRLPHDEAELKLFASESM